MKHPYWNGVSVGQWAEVDGEGAGTVVELHPDLGYALVEVIDQRFSRRRKQVPIHHVHPLLV